MASLNKLIDLDLLETFGKGTIVPMLKTIEALSASLQALDSKVDTLDANIGVLANLETTDKTNLVNAINELKAGGGGGSSVQIVPFASGTDAQIKIMLDAYYADEITWQDMGWEVGNTRKIHLNAMTAPNPNSSNTWAAQDITVVITDHDKSDLAIARNGHTKACITVQCRECINNGSGNDGTNGIYVNGDFAYDTTFTKWTNLYMRTYLNSTVLGAIPDGDFKSAILPSKHNRLTTNGNDPMTAATTNGSKTVRTVQSVTDILFLPSYTQIFGNTKYNYYLGGATPNSEEGTQWSYYQIASNRIKNGNNNGQPSGTAWTWWQGSPSSYYYSSTGYNWCNVTTDGNTNTTSTATHASGLAPAFVM